MNRFLKMLAFAALPAVIAVLGAPSSARASFEVDITDSVKTYTFTDGGTGVINVNINDSAYSVIGTFSTSNYPGTPDLAQLDVSYQVSTRNPTSTGGLLTMSASATGYTDPNYNPLTITSTVNGNGTGTGTLTVHQYADTSNTLFGTGVSVGAQGPFTIGQKKGYGSEIDKQFNQSGKYSITDVLTFNLHPNENTSGDAQSNVTPAPAPAGLLLAAIAVPVLGVGGWLRRRKQA